MVFIAFCSAAAPCLYRVASCLYRVRGPSVRQSNWAPARNLNEACLAHDYLVFGLANQDMSYLVAQRPL
eukprot:15474096-Alexandrium_andersonii.AAC.1